MGIKITAIVKQLLQWYNIACLGLILQCNSFAMYACHLVIRVAFFNIKNL
nr:MAG TPA: hypothetical protein [Caudoviricetes sp.]